MIFPMTVRGHVCILQKYRYFLKGLACFIKGLHPLCWGLHPRTLTKEPARWPGNTDDPTPVSL